jgi:hypothetical protein
LNIEVDIQDILEEQIMKNKNTTMSNMNLDYNNDFGGINNGR